MTSLATVAKQLGGEVRGGRVSAPGPGHSSQDRSLSVRLDDQGRLHVHSFAGDDWQRCMDHVRALSGLPAFEPHSQRETPQLRYRDHENERIEAASRAQKAAAAWRSN